MINILKQNFFIYDNLKLFKYNYRLSNIILGYSCCEPPNSSKSFLKVLFDLKICLLDENNISVFQISWQRGRAGCDYVAQILPRGKIRGAMFFVLLIGLLRLFKWSSICSVACPIHNSTFKNFSRSRMEHISIIGGFLHMCRLADILLQKH